MKKTHFLTAALALGLMTGTANAATVSSVDCTAPKVIISFASAVTASASAPTASTGLFYVGFQNGLNSTTLKEINKYSGQWDADKDQWTVYPTRDEYEGTYGWSTWGLHVKVIADGTTSSKPCN